MVSITSLDAIVAMMLVGLRYVCQEQSSANYEDPSTCGSMMLVRVGKPLTTTRRMELVCFGWSHFELFYYLGKVAELSITMSLAIELEQKATSIFTNI